MRAMQLTQYVAMAIAVVTVIFAGFWGGQILKVAFPAEGTLIVAEEGTELSVGAEGISIENGSARVISFSQPVKSLMIVIYFVFALLSFCGVAYLFSGVRKEQTRV